MKNSKEYSKKVLSLYRALKRKGSKVQKVQHDEVVHSIVWAIVSAELSEKATAAAFKKLSEHFVDWNDLRVSQTEEIADILDKDTPATKTIASTLQQVLNSIFDLHHKVSLESLKKTGKRPARQAIEKIDGISRFVVDYCVLTSLGAHAIPLTRCMLEYLKNNELVDPEADEQEVGGFLAKQIPAKNGYEFYALLRGQSESAERTKSKRKSKTKKKTKTKTKKQTKAKKKTKKKK